MSRRNMGRNPASKAVALQYGSNHAAPVVVASGMGYLAEKIVETAQSNGVPVYEDNSLATVLTQLNLGQEIPEELYKAIVEIYVYFLKFDPNQKNTPQETALVQPTLEESGQMQNTVPEQPISDTP